MHHYGRSDILDELYEQSQNPKQLVSYDIRALSREILLRFNCGGLEWRDSEQSLIVLQRDTSTQYDCYELSIREAGETDFHYYAYNGSAKKIRYDYPYGTHNKNIPVAELDNRIQRILLTGAVPDRVPNDRLDMHIKQTCFGVMGKLVMEHLAEIEPNYRAMYLAADSKASKQHLAEDLHDLLSQDNGFSLPMNQFQLALHNDMTLFSLQQKQLTEKKSEATEETSSNP